MVYSGTGTGTGMGMGMGKGRAGMLKALLKDTAIYGLVDLLFKCLSFFTFPLFSYLFTVSEYGILALLTTSTAFLTGFLACGISNSVVRYYWEPGMTDKDRSCVISTGFYFLIGWMILLTIGIVAISYLFRNHINSEYPYAWISFLTGLIGCTPTLLCIFCMDTVRLSFTPWRFALISAMQNGLTVLLSLLFVWGFGWGIPGFLFGTTLGAALSLPLAVWTIRQHLLPIFDVALAKKLFQFGYPFIFVSMAYWIFGSMDRWMLAEMSSTEQTGLYSIAFKVGSIMFLFQAAIAQAWNPRAMQLFNDDVNYRMIYSKFLNLLFFFFLLLGAILSLFSGEMLYMLTPPAYWPAAKICPYICMGLIFAGTNQVAMLGFYLAKKVHIYNVGSWIAAGTNFVLNLVLIPHFQAAGAAMATFVSYLLMTCFYLFCSQWYHPIPLDYHKLCGCLVLTLLTTAAAVFLNSMSASIEVFMLKVGLVAILIGCGMVMRIFDWKYLWQKVTS